MALEHFPTVNRLHTDVLEEKYGPIHADIVRQTRTLRIAQLRDAQNISRTYAITQYAKLPAALAGVHKAICAGAPIGKAFRAKGYAVRKNVIDVRVMQISKHLAHEFGAKTQRAKVRLSEFYAKRERSSDTPYIYAVVAEVYSPDFRPARISAVDKAQVNPATRYLEAEGITRSAIWQVLGDDNQWGGLVPKVRLAHLKDDPLIERYIRAVRRYL